MFFGFKIQYLFLKKALKILVRRFFQINSTTHTFYQNNFSKPQSELKP